MCIHHWKTKNIVVIESTRIRNEIKRAIRKKEKFVWTLFLFSKKETCAKRKKGYERGMAKRRITI